MNVQGRIICLDIGDKRIGVAISDELGFTAQGIKNLDATLDWKKSLAELLADYQVTEIVIGYPKNMNGTIGPRGELSERIADELKEEFSLPVTLADERLSTMAVEKSLIQANVRRDKRKKVIDQLAASWILQGYLEARRRSSI